MKQKYDVAAYVWPSYTGDEKRARIFWPEGYGEWLTVKNVKENSFNTPRDYVWDRKPLRKTGDGSVSCCVGPIITRAN